MLTILGARRDADGFLWVTGRVDDMLNVSGHLMSTSEVESVLTEHPRVSESAVVSRPHPVKGECLYCFVTPKENETFDKKMTDELKVLVRERIGGKLDGVNYDFLLIFFISTFRSIRTARRHSARTGTSQNQIWQNHATRSQKGCNK